MAVVSGSVKLAGPGSGSASSDGKEFSNELVKEWNARTDAATDEADVILLDSAVPVTMHILKHHDLPT